MLDLLGPELLLLFIHCSSVHQQIIDTGLDETSCFFADEDGLEIEHGSYFDGLMEEDGDVVPVPSHSDSYYYDLTRRKVIHCVKRQEHDVLQQYSMPYLVGVHQR